MKTFKLLAVFTFMLLLATTTNAQPVRPGAQHKRITHGVRNRELTRHETRQLTREQRHIRRERRIARADGMVTPGERKEIRRDIYRKKHNRRELI